MRDTGPWARSDMVLRPSILDDGCSARDGEPVCAKQPSASMRRRGGQASDIRPWASGPNVDVDRIERCCHLRGCCSLTNGAVGRLSACVWMLRALERLGAPIGLKWPNDLVACSKSAIRKLGGVLVEADVKHGQTTELLIGLGLNLRRSPAQPETATDIETECSRLITAIAVIEEVGKELIGVAESIASGSVVWHDFADEWNAACVHDGCQMSIELGDGTILHGRSSGVDPTSGALRLDCQGEIRFIVSGHVLGISFERP
jgi:biotin-(acetyl-CoA carboxylase) ligase